MNKSGFTLLEIAIAAVVIATLIGAIVFGQDLVQKARVRSLLSDKDKIVSAIYTFQKKYEYLPGDFPRATNYWAPDTCPVSADDTPKVATCNGDGNGRLNAPSMPSGHDCSTTVTSNSYEQEPYRLWQHLSNAGMYAGLYSGIQGLSILHGIPGTNIPRTSKYENVGFQIMNYNGDPTMDIGWINNYPFEYVMFIGAEDMVDNCEVNISFLTPIEAYDLDTKIDDGLPGTGNLRPYWSNAPRDCATTNIPSTAQYNVDTNTAECALMVLSPI